MSTYAVQFGQVNAFLFAQGIAPGLNIATELILAGLDAVWANIRVPIAGRHCVCMW
jgi:hypothetical protein